MKVEVYIIIVIGILSAVTLDRGIHLYLNDKYERISSDLDKIGYSPIVFNTEVDKKDDNEKRMQRKQLLNERTTLRVRQFRIELFLSVAMLILAYFIPNNVIRHGLMLGAVINIFYNSVVSWYMLKEGEKFSISFISLIAVVWFAISKL